MSYATLVSKSSALPASELKTNIDGLWRGSRKKSAEQEASQEAQESARGGAFSGREWSLSSVSIHPHVNSPTQYATRDQRALGSRPEVHNNTASLPLLPLSISDALKGSGQPLDHMTRGLMENHFHQDFSRVRIHTGGRAAEAAGALHAAAFTVGTDIVFGANRYAPSTSSGQLLLLHELRHAAQQRYAVPVAEPQVEAPDSPHELQARELLAPNVQPLAVQRVQRAPEDVQFSLGDGLTDRVGRSVFGDPGWPFLKAVFEGFMGGLITDIASGRADKAKKHLAGLLIPWNAVKFYGGYLVGLVIGFVSPITDLVKGVIGGVRLAISALDWLSKWSPPGIAASPKRQLRIVQLVTKFSELAKEWSKAVDDFTRDPVGTIRKIAGFLNDLMRLTLGKAREFGARAAHSIFDFLEKKYLDMGQSIGEVIGALIAQVLLLVFSDAIGNLISKGASLLGKAAEFVAGKAVEVFEWIKAFASEVGSLIRSAVKGALKLFEGLANKAIEAFDALKAIFVEAFGATGEKVAAGVGRGVRGAARPHIMESRMVSRTRTAPAKVADLTPPKVHPSKVATSGGRKPQVPIPSEQQKSVEVVEDIAGFQPAGRSPEVLREDIGEFKRSPGGRQEPLSAAIGNWADRNFEKIEDVILPHAENLVSERLPGRLDPQFIIKDHPSHPRLDRVDWQEGVVYEIKPRSRYRQGLVEAQGYAVEMDKYHRLSGGRRWKYKCVTYDMKAVSKFLQSIRYFAK